jgi:hypothetical protein
MRREACGAPARAEKMALDNGETGMALTQRRKKMDDDGTEIATPETEEWNLLNSAIAWCRAVKQHERTGEKLRTAEEVLLSRYKAYELKKRRKKSD